MKGVLINVDDILLYRNTMAEHNKRPQQVCQKLIKAEVTFDIDKCTWNYKKNFLDTLSTKMEYILREDRVVAIPEMRQTQNVTKFTQVCKLLR